MCRAQVACCGAGGGSKAVLDREIVIVGWRPVGWSKETVYVASLGRGWWRDGKENNAGSVRLLEIGGKESNMEETYSSLYPVQQHPTTHPS